MKIFQILWVYFWIFQEVTNADETCKDSSDYCQQNMCRQPGFPELCRKTCGLCTDSGDCPSDYYKGSAGSCLPCTIKPSTWSFVYNSSCTDTGCPRGIWGDRCTRNCSMGCVDNNCDHVTGSCVRGCNPCYAGSLCDSYTLTCMECNITICTCKAGFYGTDCTAKCSANCKGKVCDNGACTHGCVRGTYGPKCDKHCSNCYNNVCSRDAGTCTEGCKTGYYGIKCDKNCSVNCVGNICDQTDGRCHNCSSGQFGDTCNKTCSDKCDTESCDRTDGSCSPCMSGFTGYQCNTQCPDQCADTYCVQHNGSCLGCKDSYRGSHCNISCPSQCTKCDQYRDRCSSCKTGWFGQTCHILCENCVDHVCSTDGTCRDGCNQGWFGYMCDKACSSRCKDRQCNRTTGQCTNGCTSTVYGEYCNTSCSNQCIKKHCSAANHTNPICTEGCMEGWWGDDCRLNCSTSWNREYCKESLASKDHAVILWVVVPSFLIVLLGILAFIVLKRNKTKKPYKMKRRIFSSAGSCVNMLSMVNPSYLGTPTGSSTPNEVENLESKDMAVQLRDDVKMKEDPFFTPARMHPRVFSSYISSDLIEDMDISTPFPCQLPDEPQLGCVWSTEIPIQNFRSYVKETKKNLGLTNQFFDLPYGKLGPCDEGEKPCNAFKNRYRNILPYDHSRVKLEPINGIPGSDYINANYVNGYGKPKVFVASQGPYGDVLWDFWRMVWEIDSGKIVMLTNFVENRKNKCEQYWPDPGQPRINYDGVYVQCVSEKRLAEYTLRTFSVQMADCPERSIKQYHYTAWPDKGVPQCVTSLVDFHQLVKQAPAARYGPIIVHCSAGVGRTGTFIALDYLIAQARAEGVVDVYECVTRLRHQRMDVIQTEEQYMFLHDAVVEALPSADKPSKETTGNHVYHSKHELDVPSKRGPDTVRNPFVDQKCTTSNRRYQTRQLRDIPMDTFSSLFSTAQDRRS